MPAGCASPQWARLLGKAAAKVSRLQAGAGLVSGFSTRQDAEGEVLKHGEQREASISGWVRAPSVGE